MVGGFKAEVMASVPDAYIGALRPPQDVIAKITGVGNAGLELDESLIEAAREALPENEEFPLSFLQRRFRIGYSHALRLHQALSMQG